MADPPPSHVTAESEEKKLLSCYQCRSRKLKCNRVWPCSRCHASGAECQFPTGRMKPKEPIKRTRYKQIESRLHELEHRFKKDDTDNAQAQTDYPTPVSSSSELLHTGRFEQHPPQDIVDELTNLYFLHLYPNAPMQHPGRYFASLLKPPHLQPPMCLQYIILALGATVSPQHKDLALPFYHRARRYMDHDDMTDDGYMGMTVAHAQCWELLSHFEATQTWFTRAPTSISRSVRLAQMLGLDSIDGGPGTSRTVLPPARDWTEQEERRRTMWSIFCTDLDTSSTTGWPTLLKTDKIHTLLPASDESFIEGYEENSVPLNRALRDPSMQYSTYACRILATLLYHECTSHTMQNYSTVNHDGEPGNDSDQHFDLPNSEEFARTHMRLDNHLLLMLMALPTDLASPSRLDGQLEAAPVVLKLHSSVIAIHRKLTARLRSSLNIGIDVNLGSSSGSSDPGAVLAQLVESSARMLVAADHIYSLLVSTSRDPIVDFSNMFVTFGAFMASFAFLEDFATTQSAASEVKLGVLMDLLIEGAEGNSMAASLAVQLGHEAYKSGMDRAALGKVMHIINKMQPDYRDNLMGQQDEQSGGTVFCPLARMFPGGS